MAFVTSAPYHPGSIVQLELRVPDVVIAVQATVKHCSQGVTGVEFINLSGQNRVLLTAFCLGELMGSTSGDSPSN